MELFRFNLRCVAEARKLWIPHFAVLVIAGVIGAVWGSSETAVDVFVEGAVVGFTGMFVSVFAICPMRVARRMQEEAIRNYVESGPAVWQVLRSALNELLHEMEWIASQREFATLYGVLDIKCHMAHAMRKAGLSGQLIGEFEQAFSQATHCHFNASPHRVLTLGLCDGINVDYMRPLIASLLDKAKHRDLSSSFLVDESWKRTREGIRAKCIEGARTSIIAAGPGLSPVTLEEEESAIAAVRACISKIWGDSVLQLYDERGGRPGGEVVKGPKRLGAISGWVAQNTGQLRVCDADPNYLCTS